MGVDPTLFAQTDPLAPAVDWVNPQAEEAASNDKKKALIAALPFIVAFEKAYDKGAADGNAGIAPSLAEDPAWSNADNAFFQHGYGSAWNANKLIDPAKAPTRKSDFKKATGDALTQGIADGYVGAEHWHEPALQWWVGYKQDLKLTYELAYVKGQSIREGEGKTTTTSTSGSKAGWIVGGLAAVAVVFGVGYALQD